MRALARVAIVVSETPWLLAGTAVGLADDDLVHAVMLAAYFGHLNRIADVVGVPLDYPVRHEPPRPDPAVPALAPAPRTIAIDPAPLLARRAATAQAISAWQQYVFERDAPLARADRHLIAAHVARLLGHEAAAATPTTLRRDTALVDLARLVTLAPWQLTDASFAALRALGFDDAALFDACVVASTAGMTSRISVALARSSESSAHGP